MLAHIGGVPIEESLLYLAPVVIVVGGMYVAGWRERRRADALAARRSPGQTEPDEPGDSRPAPPT